MCKPKFGVNFFDELLQISMWGQTLYIVVYLLIIPDNAFFEQLFKKAYSARVSDAKLIKLRKDNKLHCPLKRPDRYYITQNAIVNITTYVKLIHPYLQCITPEIVGERCL